MSKLNPAELHVQKLIIIDMVHQLFGGLLFWEVLEVHRVDFEFIKCDTLFNST
jgi:hypothetical protein